MEEGVRGFRAMSGMQCGRRGAPTLQSRREALKNHFTLPT